MAAAAIERVGPVLCLDREAQLYRVEGPLGLAFLWPDPLEPAYWECSCREFRWPTDEALSHCGHVTAVARFCAAQESKDGSSSN